MNRFFKALVAAAALAAATGAQALEVVSPRAGSVLKEGRVVVIGTAKAEKGKAEYDGQATSFRVRDGFWTVALNLNPGTHEISFTSGSDTVKVNWTVEKEAKKGVYRYHPGVENDKCANCHEGGFALTRDDAVATVCIRCHKALDAAEYVHGPVALGLCAVCHDPHGSPLGKFLRMEVMELCQDCHNQPVSEKHRKEAGDEPCTECHNPHSSSKPFMVR